jgi:hypothetical protein
VENANSGDVGQQPDEAGPIDPVSPQAADTSPITPVAAPASTNAESGPTETPNTQGSSVGIASGAPVSVSANPNTPTAAPAGAPREVKLLVPEKTFRAAGPEGALRVTYDDLDLLKVLNMEPVTVDAPDHFPQWLTDLEGKRIRLRGYMRPDLVAEGLTGFILARDTQACCFGPNTKPYDIIPTMLREGVTTEYIELRPFDVVGVFHIEVNETRSRTGERKVEFLYNIDDAVIIQL